MFRNKRILGILLILLFGLTPLLWFSGKEVILGHDSGLPLFPIGHFLDRLYVWTERYGFGLDQSFALPGFFIHGLEALVAFLGASTQLEQKITFIFWLVLPGISMYLLANKFEKQLKLKYFAVSAALFYMINHFLLQSWYIAERTKYSVYAALPLILYFLFEWSEKKKSTLLTSIAISFIIFFLNGGGAVPLFGGVLVSGIVFLLFYFLSGVSIKKIVDLILLFILTGIFSVVLNAYWLLPYGFHVLKNYASEVTLFGGLGGVLGWLTSISQDASLINLLRLQGIPEWYQNPFQPYSPTFLNNPLFVLLSFLIPLCAFLPLLLYRNRESRKYILFFSFLALFSMIFVAGAHAPFGALYIFLIKTVPGFVAFRTPFYKFAPALWFSYAMLLGFFVSFVFTKQKNKVSLYGGLVLLLGLFILYNYPFFTGSFFNYMVGRRSTRLTVPQYITDYAEWSEKTENKTGKTLALPPTDSDNRIDVFNWGYLSNQPFTSVISNAPIINKNYYMPQPQLDLVNTLYSQIKNGDQKWKNLAQLLGIQYLLLRNDFDFDNKEYPTENPAIYKQSLEKLGVKPYKMFDEWIIYKVSQKTPVKETYLSYVVGTAKDISLITSSPTFNNNEVFYISGDAAGNSDQLLNLSNRVYIKPDCIACTLERLFIRSEDYMPLLTRGSRIYELKLKINKLLGRGLLTGDVLQDAYGTFQSALAFQRVVDEERGLLVYIQTMKDYNEHIKAYQKELESYLSGKEFINEASFQEIEEVLSVERNILISKSNEIRDEKFLKELREAFKTLEETREFFSSRYWRSSTEEEKKYIVSIPKSDEYVLLYKATSQNTIPSEIKIDDSPLSISPIATDAGWLKMGTYPIKKGAHTLEVTEPVANLYVGSNSATLTSDTSGKCIVSNKINGGERDVFHISLEYMADHGSKKVVVAILKNNQTNSIVDINGDELEPRLYWDRFQTTKILEVGEKFFYVGICYKPFATSEAYDPSVFIRNISIRKITAPQVFLYSELRGNPISVVSAKKQNQTHYVASTQDSQNLVVLNQSYNVGWESSVTANHFMLNGYSNGWIVEQKGSIDISYSPQDFVKKGAIVTVISIIILGGTFIFLYIKQNEKKNS